MMELNEAYDVGLIPFAPIFKALEPVLKKLDAYEATVDNPLQFFANYCEVPIELLQYPELHQYIDFDSADRLLVKTKQTVLWVSDKELKKHYEKVNLAAVDAISPVGRREDQDQLDETDTLERVPV